MAEFKPHLPVFEIPSEIHLHDSTALPGILQYLDYPTTRTEMMQKLGKVELLWNRQEPITLEDVLREIPQSGFETPDTLLRAILGTIRLAYGDHSAEDNTPILSPKSPHSTL